MPIDPKCLAFLLGDKSYRGNGSEFSKATVRMMFLAIILSANKYWRPDDGLG